MTTEAKRIYIEEKLGKGYFVDSLYNNKLINREQKEKLDIICNNTTPHSNKNYKNNYILAVNLMYNILKKDEEKNSKED